jgi:hypothetical protein
MRDKIPFMDIERTIQFLLNNQARFDARMAKAEARATRADRRMDRLEKLVYHLTVLMSQQQAALHRMNKKTDERLQKLEGMIEELTRNMNNFLRAQARRNGSGR